MPGQSSAFGGPATSLELRYTGKPVSGWGGLVAVMRYLERRGVRRVLEGALPDGRTSPNQIPVVDLVLAFFAGPRSRRFRLDRDDDDPRRSGDARATYGVETHTSCTKYHDGLPFQLVSAGPAVPSGEEPPARNMAVRPMGCESRSPNHRNPPSESD